MGFISYKGYFFIFYNFHIFNFKIKIIKLFNKTIIIHNIYNFIKEYIYIKKI